MFPSYLYSEALLNEQNFGTFRSSRDALDAVVGGVQASIPNADIAYLVCHFDTSTHCGKQGSNSCKLYPTMLTMCQKMFSWLLKLPCIAAAC